MLEIIEHFNQMDNKEKNGSIKIKSKINNNPKSINPSSNKLTNNLDLRPNILKWDQSKIAQQLTLIIGKKFLLFKFLYNFKSINAVIHCKSKKYKYLIKIE
jgi:hypothetical protein